MSDVRFLIDLTTSRGYKGLNAVGIVRTEREIGKAFLASGYLVEFFRFDIAVNEFLIIPKSEAAAILGVSDTPKQNKTIPPAFITTNSSEQATDEQLRLFLSYLTDDLLVKSESPTTVLPLEIESEFQLDFFDGDVIISAGLLWDINFLEKIYSAKSSSAIKLIQVVYDIVPIVMPEFCVPGMNIRFPKFILDAAWTSDALYCISDSTLRDVKNYLEEYNLPMPELRRFELGADVLEIPKKSSDLETTLKPGKFIVYVSTIEPRKNHIMLFHVWRTLYQTDRKNLMPLVIIGRHGWNSTDFINMIQSADHLFPKYIKIMTEVSDTDLDWLYRNCNFTVYPSLYEGWGLPVAESLARGKFCIASDTSSLPEVAEGLADLIDPLDLISWTKSVRHYLNAPAEIAAHEAKIKERYRSVPWATAMERFVASVIDLVDPVKTAVGGSQVAVGH